ncbi:MAG: GTP-dependent dephospho-CoA kinase family protein [Nitrososphaeraceae archaeon]|nr:GTP-dependent dephospho-CoA kinase family protein [Nitrososphaeraceae archaeon]
MPINEKHIEILKKPFGDLISNEDVTKNKILEIINKLTKGNQIPLITVGDATTEKILSFGIFPQLAIIDGVERRIKRSEVKNLKIKKAYSRNEKIKIYKCINKQGSISSKAYNIIKTIITKKEKAILCVDGEEDLLALPVFVLASENSLILYGQPLEGLVVVKTDKELREKAQNLLDDIGLVD